MKRRSFLQALGLGTVAAAVPSLVLPHEPKRIYSFGDLVGVQTSRIKIVGVPVGARVLVSRITIGEAPDPEAVILNETVGPSGYVETVRHYTEDRMVVVRIRKPGIRPFEILTTMGKENLTVSPIIVPDEPLGLSRVFGPEWKSPG